MFYPYSIKISKCGGNCNNINDPYATLCVPDIVKNINVKLFNLMSRINETRQIIWHETCKYICRLSAAICNTKQVWNEDKCRAECKEDLIDKMVCVTKDLFALMLLMRIKFIMKHLIQFHQMNVLLVTICCIICSIFNNKFNNWQ